MSMWLEYAKVSKETLERIKDTPKPMIDAIWFGEGDPVEGVDLDSDVIGLDYRTLVAMWEGMEEVGLDMPWTQRATGEDFGNVVDYELSYGPVFYFTPQEVSELASGLTEDEWDVEDDFEENIGRFFAIAAREGKAVIGGIS